MLGVWTPDILVASFPPSQSGGCQAHVMWTFLIVTTVVWLWRYIIKYEEKPLVTTKQVISFSSCRKGSEVKGDICIANQWFPNNPTNVLKSTKIGQIPGLPHVTTEKTQVATIWERESLERVLKPVQSAGDQVWLGLDLLVRLGDSLFSVLRVYQETQ